MFHLHSLNIARRQRALSAFLGITWRHEMKALQPVYLFLSLPANLKTLTPFSLTSLFFVITALCLCRAELLNKNTQAYF